MSSAYAHTLGRENQLATFGKAQRGRLGLSLFFYFLAVPFVLHGYAMNLALIYWNSMPVLVGFFLLWSLPMLRIRMKVDAELFILLAAVASTALPLLFGVNYIRDAIKYALYFGAYYWLFKPYFSERRFYNGFLNIILFFLLTAYPLFLLDVVAGFDFHSAFRADDMLLPSQLKIVGKEDSELYFPFYYYVVQNFKSWDLIEYSLVGIPRFYGFAHEPSSFAVVLLPLVIISHHLKRYGAMVILVVSMVLVSSYFSLMVMALILPFLMIPEKRSAWIAMMMVAGVILVAFWDTFMSFIAQSQYTSRRYGNYMTKLDASFQFEVISSVNITDNEQRMSTASGITHTLRYGMVSTAAFISWALLLLKRSIKPFRKHAILIIGAVMLLAQKSAALYDPLLIFFLNYVNVVRKDLK